MSDLASTCHNTHYSINFDILLKNLFNVYPFIVIKVFLEL